MSDTMLITIWVFASIICGAVGAWAGETKGRATAGFWLGLFFGPLGWITILLMERPAPPPAPAPTPAPEVPAGTPAPTLDELERSKEIMRKALSR